jgi:predicted amidohydrolase
MIVDPWGEILANLNQESEGFITNQINIEEVKKTREKLPISR